MWVNCAGFSIILMHNTVNTEKKLSKMTTSALIYNTLTLSFPLCMVLGHTDIFLFHSVLANTAVLIPLTFTQKMNSLQPKTTVFYNFIFFLLTNWLFIIHWQQKKIKCLLWLLHFLSHHSTVQTDITFCLFRAKKKYSVQNSGDWSHLFVHKENETQEVHI